MTQEDKELLLKDLSARLPYDVMLNISVNKYTDKTFNAIISTIDYCGEIKVRYGFEEYEQVFSIEQIKPYLFPLSSMTEDMMEELNANGFFKYRDSITNVSHLEGKNGISEEIYTYIDIESISFLTEYFHSHHIDYRGLIEKGLAIDATGLNIY